MRENVNLFLHITTWILFTHSLIRADPPGLHGHLSLSQGATGSLTPLSSGEFPALRPRTPSSEQLAIWSLNNSYNGNGPEAATNLHGAKLPSLSASQAIGTRGQVLLQDFFLLEKLQSYNRQRIPERVVHAKGAGAHGYFVVTNDISHYTKAHFLNKIGRRTPCVARFSTATGERASPDTVVDTKGFAVKFKTQEGNYDFVGFNTETFPIRDPMLFPDVNSSRKKNPQTNRIDPNMFWDFISLRPESSLNTLHLFSDIGRPNGYRRMDGHAVHAWNFVNSTGKVTFAKIHLISDQPGRALTFQESAALVGANQDYNTQDLYDAIAEGNFPSWTMYIQVMSLEQAKKYPDNPFDITRTWRRDQFPLIPVGKMVLDNNPINYFVNVEQAAFAPSNLVPGIEPSPDRVLAGRLFAYQDTQRYRLGVNFPMLPINSPVVEVNSYARDGPGCYGDNGGGGPNYFPNSWGGDQPDPVRAGHTSFAVEGIVDRYDVPAKDEHDESRLFIEKDIDRAERKRLVDSIADYMKTTRGEVVERVLRNIFYPMSHEFGDEVRRALDAAVKSLATNKDVLKSIRSNKICF